MTPPTRSAGKALSIKDEWTGPVFYQDCGRRPIQLASQLTYWMRSPEKRAETLCNHGLTLFNP